MTTVDDLAALVAEGDLELGLLSEEEYVALWLDRALREPDSVPSETLVAVKSLLSSERAHLVDDELVLGGFLGLIRFASDAATVEVDLEVEGGDSFSWSTCGPVLLQRDWSPPGLFRFVLRSRPRALTGLVRDLFSVAPETTVRVSFTVAEVDEDTPGQGPDPQVFTFVRETGVATWSGPTEEPVTVDQLGLRRLLQVLLDG